MASSLRLPLEASLRWDLESERSRQSGHDPLGRAVAPRESGPFKEFSTGGHNQSITVSNHVTPKITRKARHHAHH
jgi:hypothetical protein